MATSWAKETEEKVNYTKLCRLLYDGGTLAVKTVFDGIVPPAALGVVLRTNRHTLQRLKKPAGRVLNQDQWDQLYLPSGAVPKSEDFDITLLFVLLRNICGLTPPATGWDALPAPTDASLESNLVRIKYYRNKVVAHSSEAEVDDTQFETCWKDISSALLVLGLKQNDIDELKSSPLGEKKYNQLVKYWDLSDEEIKQHLKAIQSNTSDIKITSAKVESNTTEIKSDTVEIKSKVCSIESILQNTHLDSEVDKLAHINYTSLIENNYCRKYHPSTRKWVLQQVEENIKTTASEAGAVIIRAGPGMGKSTITAKICEIYKNIGLLGGCHFFQHNNSLRNNPRIMLQSLAKQLCNTVPGYQAALQTKLNTLQGRDIADQNCEELFGMLFEEPLSQIKIDHNVVIVIDALDECASQYKEEIEDVLECKLCNLPSWIRFVITTRAPSCRNLNPADLIEIIEPDQRNVQDLITYLEFELVQRNARDLTNKFVSISSGLFLVAYFLLNILDESGKESILNADCFPHGISSVHKHYFKRIHNLLKPYIETSQPQDSFYQMLKAVVASIYPIPQEIFYEILHLKSVDDISPEKIKERNDAVHLLHTIFPVENDHVTVFHKTVTDWLTHNADNQHQFSVSVNSGLEVLVEKTLDVLEGYKERPHPLDQPLVLSNNEKFAVLFGVDYMTNVCRERESKMDEIIKNVTVAAAITSLEQLLVHYGGKFFPKPVKPFLNRLCQYRFSDNPETELYKREKNICFGLWLSVACDLLLNCKCSPLSSPEKEELRHWLVENKVPHYSVHCVASGLPLSMNLGLLKIRNGIIAVSNLFTLHCFHIKDDGSIGEKRALGNLCTLRGVSPDKRHLIITKLFHGCVELYDVMTLEKVQEYNCPMDRVKSCHTFGDAEQWYIVVKAEGNPNIYILDGLNGELVYRFKVPRDIDEIITVSQTGHILMRSEVTIGSLEPIVFNRYLLVCEVCSGVTSYSRKLDFDKICYKTNDPEEEFSLRVWESWENQGDCCRFSDDAKHFALYCSNRTVYVFHTKDGTLYRKFYFVCSNCKIIFLSSSCLIIRYKVTTEIMLDFNEPSQLAFFDLVRNKLIYCTSASIWYCCEPLVVPHQDASSTNTFFPALYGLIGQDLVKLKFHCLEQNFLDSS